MRGMIVAAVLLLGSPALAQAEVPCPAKPAPLPAELAGWAHAMPVTAGVDAAGAATIQPGHAATVTLAPTPRVRFAAAPGKAADPASHGGVLAFTVPCAGTYRVALSVGAWVDVLAGGKALKSAAHGHGPACSGMRKIVDFKLAAARHLLQIFGSPTPTITVMVAASR